MFLCILQARVIVIVLVVPVIIGFAWVVGHGFGYLEFRTVGAGAEVQGKVK